MGSVSGGLAAASVGLFVWDVGSYNRGVRGLAGGSSSARPGLVHAAGIGIVVAVSAPVAYLLYATVTPLVTPSDPSVAAVGLVVLVVVSLPLVYSLRPG